MKKEDSQKLSYIHWSIFMLLSIFIPISTFHATNIDIPKHQHTTSTSYNLILIGIVICKNSGKPAANVEVLLTDLIRKEKRIYATNDDGSFRFTLDNDTHYFLTYIGNNDSGKVISTAGRYNEVLHTLLLTDDCVKTQFYIITKEIPKDDKRWKSSSNEIPKLTYRIQIGTSETALSMFDSFRKNTHYKTTKEKTPTGHYRYLTEDFYNLENTKKKLARLKENGYDKAFIIPYFKGKRLNMKAEEAKEKYDN